MLLTKAIERIRALFYQPSFKGTTLLLDRDGTINVDTGYVSNPGDITLESHVIEGLSKLRRSGMEFVVLSNQSGIGRGMFESNDLLLINNRIDSLLGEHDPDLYIKRYLFCPHHPEDKCRCRKPRVGMYKQFQKLFPTDRVAAMVGDKYSDIKMLERYHIPSILVRTGEGRETERKILDGEVERPQNLAWIGDDLNEVATFILSGRLEKFRQELDRRDTRPVEPDDE